MFHPEIAICREDGGGGNRTRVGFHSKSRSQDELPPWEDLPLALRLEACLCVLREPGLDRDRRLTKIYAIGQEPRGLVKIGRAKDPEKRLRAMQTGSPLPLTLLAAAELPAGMERELHRELSRARVRGEWFRRTSDVLEAVDFLLDPARVTRGWA